MSVLTMQSNAIRGEFRNEILAKTIREIHDDIKTVFGPGATDAFITKDGQPYYTRDGLEVLESLTFDNQLSEYIRKMIFQAAYDQGKKVGDGTTTMVMMYTNMYELLQDTEIDKVCNCGVLNVMTLDSVRELWHTVVEDIIDRMKEKYVVPMTEERLLSMMYTCTHDKEFSAKVFNKLKRPILDGAYIIPKKSNIESDLEFTSYTCPLIKATRQFTVRPIRASEPHTVIFHCNGMIDIAHMETFYGLSTIGLEANNERINANIVILGNGITEATRRTTKEFVKYIHSQKLDVSLLNNIAIYTIDNYRGMDPDTIEDLSTVITDEEGIGGLVNSLTFEPLIYQALCANENMKIEDLETFDCDLRHIDKIRSMLLQMYTVEFDDAEGIRLHKTLGSVSQKRYDDLRKEIAEEKSEVRKYQLQKRLKTVYGQFIEVEVGSRLLKDSQRKFELFLDMIVSAAEGVRSGVLESNSLILLVNTIHSMLSEITLNNKSSQRDVAYSVILSLIQYSAFASIFDMLSDLYNITDYKIGTAMFEKLIENERHDPKRFNMNFYGEINFDELFLKPEQEEEDQIPAGYDIQVDDGTSLHIDGLVVEPVNVINNILHNSILIFEIFRARTYHISGFIQNYI